MRLPSYLFCLLGLCTDVTAREVATVDHRAPVRDGARLVAIECNQGKQELEVAVVLPGPPPGKRVDAWEARDLVVFDQTTWDFVRTLAVQRSCRIGGASFKVRLEGIPGASNAQRQCGAYASARATVWRNGRKVFDQPLGTCDGDNNIGALRFLPGSPDPIITPERPRN